MAFGMKTTSSEFLPIVKYDARAGKFFKVDKRVDGGSDAIELPMGTKFAFDTFTLEAGFVMFGPQGPVRHMVPYSTGVQIPSQPQDKDADGKYLYRAGFYAKIASNALDGVREWCSNAAVLMNALDDLYQQIEIAPETAAGKIPLISIVSTTPVKSGTGARSSTNYAPNLKIEGWVDRPEMLGARTVPTPRAVAPPQQAAPSPVASAAPATPPPAAAAAPVGAMPF